MNQNLLPSSTYTRHTVKPRGLCSQNVECKKFPRSFSSYCAGNHYWPLSDPVSLFQHSRELLWHAHASFLSKQQETPHLLVSYFSVFLFLASYACPVSFNAYLFENHLKLWTQMYIHKNTVCMVYMYVTSRQYFHVMRFAKRVLVEPAFAQWAFFPFLFLPMFSSQ